MKILIVDPDWHFAQQAIPLLEARADLVVHQPDARLAAAQALDWKPDLVMVSAEVAESGLLEALRAAVPPPAVLLTEHMQRFDRAWRAWQIGGDELFLKPILRPSDLFAAILTAMQNAATGTRATRTRLAATA